MAQKFVLVSPSDAKLFEQWKRGRYINTGSESIATANNAQLQNVTELEVNKSGLNSDNHLTDSEKYSDVQIVSKSPTDLMAFIDLLPKNQRSRARILVQAVKDHLQLSPTNRWMVTDDEYGDSIFDLIKYFTTPPHVKVPRPLTAVKFYEFLQRLDVPQAAIARDAGYHSSGITNAESSKNSIDKIRWLI